MTWYADEIMLPATPDAIAHLSADPMLRPFSYWIKDLNSYDWPTYAQRHPLPTGGLLVIRPLCATETANASWHMRKYQRNILSWTLFTTESQPLSKNSSPLIKNACDQIDAPQPPLAFRQFLGGLSVTLKTPVLYYAGAMWGGQLDQEYSLSYQPHERVFITCLNDIHMEGSPQQHENALQQGLATIGLSLPTYFFAPHTRSFPWEHYQL